MERHFSQRIGWLRAAVLGANDGLVSTASLVVGVAAAETGRSGVFPTLSDPEVAAIATYVRSAWGNRFGAVSPEDVAARR